MRYFLRRNGAGVSPLSLAFLFAIYVSHVSDLSSQRFLFRICTINRKDYTVFEQGVNPIIAEKMASERSRDYMNARRVAKEYEASTR